MARYIRTDELLATARDGYHSDFGRSMADLTSLREVIEDTPTADVVEVVRCNDCKHKGWVQEPCHGKTIDFCKLHEFCIRETDFCSYGERKKVE